MTRTRAKDMTTRHPGRGHNPDQRVSIRWPPAAGSEHAFCGLRPTAKDRHPRSRFGMSQQDFLKPRLRGPILAAAPGPAGAGPDPPAERSPVPIWQARVRPLPPNARGRCRPAEGRGSRRRPSRTPAGGRPGCRLGPPLGPGRSRGAGTRGLNSDNVNGYSQLPRIETSPPAGAAASPGARPVLAGLLCDPVSGPHRPEAGGRRRRRRRRGRAPAEPRKPHRQLRTVDFPSLSSTR